MNADTTIPLHISEEAAARIAELGMQREFEKMLEHTRETVPGVREIHVLLEEDPRHIMEPKIVIEPHRVHPGLEYDPTDRRWGEWQVTTFAPEVCWHFLMLSLYDPPDHGR
jgi:hypothetical protein